MANRIEKDIQAQSVWDVVKQIPKGRVATYGDIARLVGLIGQARFVGRALNRLPQETKIPWHRVINAQGKISFPSASSAYRHQKRLLEKEGITLERGKIDLNKYRWLKNL